VLAEVSLQKVVGARPYTEAPGELGPQQAQIAKMQQEQKWVVAGDVLFPEGGYQLSASGKQALIANNIDLSSRRADNVVAYLTSQGVNPNIISAKGFGDTHPIASNDTPDGRAKNRRIEIVLEGPGS
jgi:chemotaxis protein MotB